MVAISDSDSDFDSGLLVGSDSDSDSGSDAKYDAIINTVQSLITVFFINNRVNLLAIRVRRERANVARDAGLVRCTAGCC